MSGPTHIAVIDIGKTNAKLALVDMESLREIAVETRPNTVLPGAPWPHFDLEGHRAFILDGLARMHRTHRVDAISVTTHGASIVLLDDNGELAAPMLDYEFDGPDQMAEGYEVIRPDFVETGSPRLPFGLNVGAQLHWMFRRLPGLHSRTAQILTYPQYWGHWLTGEAASDVTSLGCHTDLWDPYQRRLSSLADRLGISAKIAPPRRPGEILGRIRLEIARATGLPEQTEVAVGIHDSNASLLPHLMGRKAPFSVVSSGTWVIVMAVGGATVALDEARDTLVNVNALGDPVRSARFMGGREHEMIAGGAAPATPEDLARMLDGGSLLLPSVVAGSGPYPGRIAGWTGPEPQGSERTAALAVYLAMMTSTCLSLAGHRGEIVVEGPFAHNPLYLDMLSVAMSAPVAASISATGTALGASLLMSPVAATRLISDAAPARLRGAPELAQLAQRWRETVRATQP